VPGHGHGYQDYYAQPPPGYHPSGCGGPGGLGGDFSGAGRGGVGGRRGNGPNTFGYYGHPGAMEPGAAYLPPYSYYSNVAGSAGGFVQGAPPPPNTYPPPHDLTQYALPSGGNTETAEAPKAPEGDSATTAASDGNDKPTPAVDSINIETAGQKYNCDDNAVAPEAAMNGNGDDDDDDGVGHTEESLIVEKDDDGGESSSQRDPKRLKCKIEEIIEVSV